MSAHFLFEATEDTLVSAHFGMVMVCLRFVSGGRWPSSASGRASGALREPGGTTSEQVSAWKEGAQAGKALSAHVETQVGGAQSSLGRERRAEKLDECLDAEAGGQPAARMGQRERRDTVL